jgi:FkbM family methyltransferase
MTTFFKLIYQPGINRILRFFIKVFGKGLQKKYLLPPSGIIDFKLKSGKKLIMKTNQTSHVTWEIVWNGYDSYEYVKLFEKLSPNINSFLDIGSNIGFYSLIFASQNPKGIAYSFEPSPGPFHYLNENIKLNLFENQIKPFKIALSDKSGKTTFVAAYTSKYSYLEYPTLGGSGHIKGARTDTSSVEFDVQTETLDRFVIENNIKSIDLIKLDTEETEHIILQNGLNTLSEHKPIVVCEIFSNQVANSLNEIFKPLNYLFFKSEGEWLIRDSEAIHREGIIDNYFFVPQEKLHLINQFLK